MRKIENSGIKMFKETFNYLIDEVLTESQFCDLMRLIYFARWGNEEELSKLEDNVDKIVNAIWRNLRHSVAKSKLNEEDYKKKKKAKEMAQNEEIMEKEYNNTKLEPNTSFYPTCDSKNQEYDDEVNDNQETLDDFAKLLESDDRYLRANTFDDCFFENKEIRDFVVMSGITNEPFIKMFNEKKIA